MIEVTDPAGKKYYLEGVELGVADELTPAEALREDIAYALRTGEKIMEALRGSPDPDKLPEILLALERVADLLSIK